MKIFYIIYYNFLKLLAIACIVFKNKLLLDWQKPNTVNLFNAMSIGKVS